MAQRTSPFSLPVQVYELSPHHSAAVAALKSLGEPDSLVDRLSSAISDEAFVERVARRSFPHPLGFDKIVLEDSLAGGKLRLHIWEPGAGRHASPDLHDHFWDFTTIGLSGVLEMLDYHFAPGATRFVHYRLLPRGDGGYRQTLVGHVELALLRTCRVGRGDIACVSSSTVHSAKPADDRLCATLVLQGPPNGPCNNIFAPGPTGARGKIVKERPFTPAQLKARLATLLEAITDGVA